MTIRQRSDTAAKAEGLDARLDAVFLWLASHSRGVVMVAIGIAVLGLLSAILYEYQRRSEASAQTALATVEDRFHEAMGGGQSDFLIEEPANPEIAVAARQQALAELDAVVTEHSGTRAADVARLRAAELEAGLTNWEAAVQRLDAALAELGKDDALQAIGLRLKGYVLEQQGLAAEAGAAYAQGAEIESYPARGALWIEAAEAYRRAGNTDQAIAAYQEALSTDAELAEQMGIIERLNALAPAPSPAP